MKMDLAPNPPDGPVFIDTELMLSIVKKRLESPAWTLGVTLNDDAQGLLNMGALLDVASRSDADVDTFAFQTPPHGLVVVVTARSTGISREKVELALGEQPSVAGTTSRLRLLVSTKGIPSHVLLSFLDKVRDAESLN